MPNDKLVQNEINNVDEYSDIRQAVEDGTLTQRSTVARETKNQRSYIADTGETTRSDTLSAVVSNDSTDKLTVIYRLEWYNGSGSDYF